jgi:hypothetical protein
MPSKKTKKVFVIITIIASLALLLGAVLPYLIYLQ